MTVERDLELLRRFEPVIRYTRGELFFPMAVGPYVAACDLWAGSPTGERTQLVPVGGLTIETLPEWQARVPDQSLFLRFVQEPLGGIDLARWNARPDRPGFSAPSRLARVGIVARLIDAGFDVSLLVRGTVPGGTAAAAEVKYAAIRGEDPGFYYHGRVVRQAGWAVCHYLFFYAMNDWRSTFSGANDHEADWEQCFVFLEEHDDGSATPVWFARAAHDEVGADLRRRWDDELLIRDGDHPVIFAGAGSHAAYIEQGEYLQSVPLQLPGGLRHGIDAVRQFWTGTLRQGRGPDEGRGQSGGQIAAVPFVDYARGDGVGIGPGQPHAWTPILIDDTTRWVSGYDGLFGLDTYDRFAGERAPAGPKFARDGRPRQSWIDPVGFAGLQAVPPPGRLQDSLAGQITELEAELADLKARVAEGEIRAQKLGVRVTAAQRAGRSDALVAQATSERDVAVDELTELRVHAENVSGMIADARTELERDRRGDAGDPRAHLRHVVHPQDPAEIRRSRLLDWWSAVSVGIALVLIFVIMFTAPWWWWIGLLVIIAGYVAIEALVRRRFLALLLDTTIILAVIGSLILIWSYVPEFIAVALLVIGFVILRDNIRELRQGSG
jgi:hypothetical protein